MVIDARPLLLTRYVFSPARPVDRLGARAEVFSCSSREMAAAAVSGEPTNDRPLCTLIRLPQADAR